MTGTRAHPSGERVRPLPGRAFEDILDGYFPLDETIRQMMRRNGFRGAWLTLLHAPVMEVEGLRPGEPVPLHLRGHLAGMIDRLAVEARMRDGAVRLRAVGDWWWVDPARAGEALTAAIRLGEPAFVRGVGVGPAPACAEGRPTLALVRADARDPEPALAGAASALGWTSLRAFAIDEGVRSIERDTAPGTLFGRTVEAGPAMAFEESDARLRDILVLNTSEIQDDPEARDLAKLV